MKIDTDLRQAVRSACNAQPRTDWREDEKRRAAAIQELINKPKHKHRLARTLSVIKKSKNELESAHETLSSIGISSNLTSFTDDELFVKAGGVIPKGIKPWGFDDVMKELAAAAPTQRKAILKKYGINWE